MPQISRPELVAKIRERFEISGDAGLDTLSPELVAVVLADDVRDQEVRRYAHGGASVSPAVGFIPEFQVFNPPDSGIIVIVQQALFSSVTGVTLWRWGPAAAVLATDAAGVWQDRRLSGNPVGRIQFTNTNAAPSLTNTARINTLQETAMKVDGLNFLLPPGNALRVEGSTQQQGASFGFQWFERDPFPRELD